MKQIKPEQLAQEVALQLAAYSDGVRDKMFSEIDKLSERVRNEVQNHAPQKTGRYRRSIKVKNVYTGKFDKRNVVHASGKMYKLTHLLESGHLAKGGTKRVKGYPHFAYGEKMAESGIIEIAKEAAKP